MHLKYACVSARTHMRMQVHKVRLRIRAYAHAYASSYACVRTLYVLMRTHLHTHGYACVNTVCVRTIRMQVYEHCAYACIRTVIHTYACAPGAFGLSQIFIDLQCVLISKIADGGKVKKKRSCDWLYLQYLEWEVHSFDYGGWFWNVHLPEINCTIFGITMVYGHPKIFL